MRILAAIVFMLICAMENGDAQSERHFQINSSENVQFIVTDPVGRRTGADPRGVHADTLYKVTFLSDIPEASHVYTENASLNPNAPKPPESHEFMDNPHPSPPGTLYTVEVVGVELSDYWLDVYARRATPSNWKRWTFQERDAIEKDTVVTYQFFLSDANTSESTFVKLVTAGSLFRDIPAMRKLNWITNQHTADKYVDLVTSYNTQLTQNNLGGARTTLTTILQNIASDSMSTLTTDACKSLHRDVEYLLAQLPAR